MSIKRPKIEDFPYFKKFNNLSDKINREWLRAGCREQDCIPSIDNPKWVDHVTITSEWQDDPEVLVLIYPGDKLEHFAAPIAILDYHEVINFKTSTGTPVALTYCPLCQTATGYIRELDGKQLELGVSGLLYNSALFLYDRPTDSLFSQVYSEGVLGDFVGKKLTQLPIIQTKLSKLRNAENIKFLSRDTGNDKRMKMYQKYPYKDYKESERVPFPTYDFDNCLHPKSLVYHIDLEKQSYIIPKKGLKGKTMHSKDLFSLTYLGGRLFFNQDIDVVNFTKWTPATISFYFAARSYFPKAQLLTNTKLFP